MASGILPFRPELESVQRMSAKPDNNRRVSSPQWWSSIFGFSSEPDYLNPDGKNSSRIPPADGDPKPVRCRFAPGSFTEEKARLLRRMTFDASSFHDSMYHSAIASRLASDFSARTAA